MERRVSRVTIEWMTYTAKLTIVGQAIEKVGRSSLTVRIRDLVAFGPRYLIFKDELHAPVDSLAVGLKWQ